MNELDNASFLISAENVKGVFITCMALMLTLSPLLYVFLIIYPHKVQAEGKAVLILLCCYYSSVVSGDAVKYWLKVTQEEISVQQTSSNFFLIKALLFSIFFP